MNTKGGAKIPSGKRGFAPPPKMSNPMPTIKRLMSYMKNYKGRFIFVLICILISAGAGVASSSFIQILIDNFITPMIKTKSRDFSGLLSAMALICVILLLGVLATLLYNIIMVTISQGIQKKIRDEMYALYEHSSNVFFTYHNRICIDNDDYTKQMADIVRTAVCGYYDVHYKENCRK